MRKVFSVKCWTIINGIALLILAVAFIIALFVENQWGHSATCYLVCNACWFKIFCGLLLCIIIANLFVFNLFRVGRFSLGLFHLALLFVLLGALLINLMGQKGIVRLRQGQSMNYYVSDRPFFKAELTDNGNHDVVEKEIFLTSFGANQLNFHVGEGPGTIFIRSGEIIDKAIPSIVPDLKGTAMLELMVGTAEGMKTVILQPNSTGAFSDPDHSTEMPLITIVPLKGSVYLSASDTLHSLNLSTRQHNRIAPGKLVAADARLLYSSGKTPFLFGHYLEHASVDYIIGDNTTVGQPVIVVEVATGGKKEIIPVSGKEVHVLLGKSMLNLKFGYKKYPLPFTLGVKEVLSDKTIGTSQGPNICLTDKNSNQTENYFISSDHILKNHGYRFSMIDSKDNGKEITLAVTHSCIGETLSNVGFFLIVLSLFWFILDPAGYCRKLMKQRKNMKPILFLLLLWCFTSSFSYANSSLSVNPKVASQFGHLWVKSSDGRIGTVNTLDRELLKRINGHFHFRGMNADQVILSMMLNPLQWQNENILKTHRDLAAEMGFPSSWVTYNSLFDAKGKYLIDEEVREARSKTYEMQTPYERVIVALDDKVSIMNKIFNGTLWNIFPDHRSGNWLNPISLRIGVDTIRNQENWSVLGRFFLSVKEGRDSDALQSLQEIATIQQEEGTVPSNLKRYAELIYNRISVLNILLFGYLIWGGILLLLGFVRIANPSIRIVGGIMFPLGITWLLFLFHLSIILLKSYITGSCPWNGGSEWLFFLSYGIVLLGCLVGKNDYFTVGSSCFLAGIILFVMNSSGMNLPLKISDSGELFTWQNSYLILVALGIGFILLCAFQNLWGIVLTVLKPYSNENFALQVSGELSFWRGFCVLIFGLVTGVIGTGGLALCGVRELWLLVMIIMIALVALSLCSSQHKGVWRNIVMLAVVPVAVINIVVFYGYFIWNGYHCGTNIMNGIIWVSAFVCLGGIILTGIVGFRKESNKPVGGEIRHQIEK